MNRQTRRLLKKQNKEIEDFIKWLKMFYSSSEKDKQAILLTLSGKNDALFKFVNDLKDINEQQQEKLYSQLRGEV